LRKNETNSGKGPVCYFKENAWGHRNSQKLEATSWKWERTLGHNDIHYNDTTLRIPTVIVMNLRMTMYMIMISRRITTVTTFSKMTFKVMTLGIMTLRIMRVIAMAFTIDLVRKMIFRFTQDFLIYH
jgi:hypothetical protein